MKRIENVKLKPAIGFSTASDSLGGLKTLGLYGSMESVSFPFIHLNSHVQRFYSGMWQKHFMASFLFMSGAIV
jgi:hypothetical protein